MILVSNLIYHLAVLAREIVDVSCVVNANKSHDSWICNICLRLSERPSCLVDTLLPRESAGAEERRGGVEVDGVARHGDVGCQEEERGYPHGEEALAAWLGLGLG